jgi:hypothetical protein
VFQVTKTPKYKTRDIPQSIREYDKNSSDNQTSSENENLDKDFVKDRKHDKVVIRRYPRRDRRQPEPPKGKLLAQYLKKRERK